MKKLIIALCLILIPALSFGATVPLKWDTALGATGYKIYQSVNAGQTWTLVQDVGNVLSYTILNAPDTGLVLYRLGAYNAQGEVVRTNAGAWFNGALTLPGNPGGVGVP